MPMETRTRHPGHRTALRTGGSRDTRSPRNTRSRGTWPGISWPWSTKHGSTGHGSTKHGSAGHGSAGHGSAGRRATRARNAGRRASDSTALEYLARAGFLARGLMYVVIGWIAVEIAFGQTSQQADRTGALPEV